MPVNEGQEPEATEPQAPDLGTTAQGYDPREFRPKVGDPEEPQAPSPDVLYDDDGKPLPSFDPQYANDFEGLMFLGALMDSFNWLGHRFVIRTLNSADLLAVPLVIKPWQGSMGEAKAYAIAMAALAVVSVDEEELPIPVGDAKGDYAWAFQRFEYAKANWFQWTIDKIYSEFLALESRANAVIEAMEKASGPAASTAGSNAASAGPTDKAF